VRLKKWEDLPECMQKEAIKPYYAVLARRETSLALKRFFDWTISLILLVILIPLFIVIAVAVKRDSAGKVFYSQVRVTTYGRKYRILKFRTMVENAENKGPQITANLDARITRAGKFLRKYRLDELPQLLNILMGDMAFVGTRPEAPKYVQHYTDEMWATLLLPAGVTSKASIMFRDESEMLTGEIDVEETYIRKILPIKMKYNLEALKSFNLFSDIVLILQTVLSVWGIGHSKSRSSDKLSFKSGVHNTDVD
jgi:lipopolysaccharide/colanic/teichoic acid biosynthesis glycosyltransferase